jgi:hypothetical protein
MAMRTSAAKKECTCTYTLNFVTISRDLLEYVITQQQQQLGWMGCWFYFFAGFF